MSSWFVTYNVHCKLYKGRSIEIGQGTLVFLDFLQWRALGVLHTYIESTIDGTIENTIIEIAGQNRVDLPA